MALPQLHVACGFAGGDGSEGKALARQPIFRDLKWSEEPPSGTQTTNEAPEGDTARPIFRITPAIDIYVAIGRIPNPSDPAKRLALRAADAPHDVYVKAGDRLAWVAA